MTPSRQDPYPEHNFRVEIEGLTLAGFMECTGLESETEVIEYREGDWFRGIRKLPGLTRFGNISLKRGVTKSTELYEWRKSIIRGEIQGKTGNISLLDEKGEPVAVWVFFDGWPCRLSGPDLNALESGVAIEELVICHQGLERVA